MACTMYGHLDGVGIFVCHTSIQRPAGLFMTGLEGEETGLWIGSWAGIQHHRFSHVSKSARFSQPSMTDQVPDIPLDA